ncbi:DUF397 domain-containing protein [Streptomyces sp. NBRC 110035]|uniref:DUF397 domain-containing protein n=1 Tax=Streptomyces sp. NBRC 110035 TaxID=1547867 RepID=UPI0005AA1D00|nr:DUF397 domain-containing protein [Streptomyces sp. NBRC 110035]
MIRPGTWQRPSFSGSGDGNNCVEIALLSARIAIRDSKNLSRGTVTIPVGSFTALVQSLKTTTT